MISQNSRLQTVETDSSIKVSVLMPADMIAALKVAGFQRRSLGEDNSAISFLVREAVSEWLEREINNTSVVSIRI